MWCRYSGAGRVGYTGAEGTEWVSESSVVCKTGAGGFGSVVVVVTTGQDVGSLSVAVSYDGSMISSVRAVNEGGSGGGGVSVSGADLGTGR